MSNEIFQLIPRVMRDIGAVSRGRTNTHQNYKFRGIEDMYNAIHPALIEHGVFCVPQVIDSQSCDITTKKGDPSYRVLLKINHKFYAPDGSFVEVITMGEGVDNSDKATNKAMSAAMKYAFIELFSIPTADIDDGDKESPAIGASKPISNAPHNARVIGALAAQIPVAVKTPTGQEPYLVPFGKKYGGRAIETIEIGELQDYMDFLERSANEQRKPLQGNVLEFMERAKNHIEMVKNTDDSKL